MNHRHLDGEHSEPPKGARAVIYTRISKDVARTGAGVRRQLADCRQFVEEKGWKVVKVLTDNDTSAFSGTPRPGYEELLRGIQEDRYDVIVCWHTDRLYRRVRDLEAFIDICQPRKVPTYAVKAGALDLRTPSGRMSARVTGAVAQYEAEQKGLRHRAANRQRALDGYIHTTRRCFGYETDGVTIREEEAKAIREGAETLLRDGSLNSIAKRWNAAGLLPPQGKRRTKAELEAHAEAVEEAVARGEELPPLPPLKPSQWSSDTVRTHYRSHRIAAIVTHQGKEVRDPKTGEPVKAKWPPILKKKVWDAVQVKLAENAELRRFPSGERQLLSGIALCDACKGPMMSGGTRNGRRRYRCRQNGSHVYRESAPIDDLVERTVVAYLARPDALTLLAPVETPDVDVQAVQRELATLESEAIEMAEAHAQGHVTLAQLIAFNRRSEDRRAVLAAKLPVPTSPVVRQMLEADDMHAAWEALDQDGKRTLINALCTVELVSPGTKENAYLDWRRRIINPDTVKITWQMP